MALRIGGPVEEPIEETATPELELPAEEAMPMIPEMGGGGMVTPEAARYFGPESRCEGCVHFMAGELGGSCEIVSGPIDPMGVCSLFTPDSMEMMPDETLQTGSPVEPEINEETPTEGY